jgi:hypothetical protein
MTISEIEKIIRMALNRLVQGGQIIGQLLMTEQLFKSLENELEYSQFGNGLRALLDEGKLSYYPDGKNTNTGFMLTRLGYEWAENNQSPAETNEEHDSEYQYFIIPPEASEKIKKLINEINVLPKKHISSFYNLIAHQIRTIFALSLIEYWKNNGKELLPENKKGLKKIITYTINHAVSAKLNESVKLVELLKETKESRIKDLCDDVVHCSYSLIGIDDLKPFLANIKNLLSLIYGR